jgi:hypothetical protein
MKQTGIVILLIGLALTIFTTFKFFTKEKVVDIGTLEITRDKPHSFAWSPMIGIVIIGLGGVVLWKSSRNNIK